MPDPPSKSLSSSTSIFMDKKRIIYKKIAQILNFKFYLRAQRNQWESCFFIYLSGDYWHKK